MSVMLQAIGDLLGLLSAKSGCTAKTLIAVIRCCNPRGAVRISEAGAKREGKLWREAVETTDEPLHRKAAPQQHLGTLRISGVDAFSIR